MPRMMKTLSHRTQGSRADRSDVGAGAVIAFVGSEATGKSTVIGEIDRRLSGRHAIRRIHAGKPPATAPTFVPHVLLPALRALLPSERSTRVEARHADGGGGGPRTYPLPFAVRSVMLAYERRALLRDAFRRAAGGTVVLSDRFPSSGDRALDGLQLGELRVRTTPRALRWLSELEARLYRDIPPADLVIHLTAPLEVTLVRNAAREKVEPEDYVRRRHAISSALEFGDVAVRQIQTDRSLEAVVDEVEQAIRDALRERNR